MFLFFFSLFACHGGGHWSSTIETARMGEKLKDWKARIGEKLRIEMREWAKNLKIENRESARNLKDWKARIGEKTYLRLESENRRKNLLKIGKKRESGLKQTKLTAKRSPDPVMRTSLTRLLLRPSYLLWRAGRVPESLPLPLPPPMSVPRSGSEMLLLVWWGQGAGEGLNSSCAKLKWLFRVSMVYNV